MKNKIFYAVCFGFGTGILWRSLFSFGLPAALFLGIIYAILFFSFLLTLKRQWLIIISLFAVAFLLGVWRMNLADKTAPAVFETEVGEKISLSGTIIEKPVEKENAVEITVETSINDFKTKILLFGRENNDYGYGDGISFSGKLEKPDNFLTDQFKNFDYVNYLKKDGIFYLIRHPEIKKVSTGGGNFSKRILFAFRDKLADAIDSVIPSPESLVVRALILGERASFSESLRQAFINTGLIHIVTISGYHVSLVAEWIMKALGFLPINFAAAGGIFALILYVIMTGGAQTAIRAGIMASLALLARITGRAYDAGRALVLAGTAMILISPSILAFDISFELSFLATLAVIFLAPKLEEYFLSIKWKWLRDIVSITCAAYIFVLPFIIYKMGNWSLVALPANFAVLPFIPVTMAFGFATAFFGLISKILAFIPGAIAYILLHYELAVINFLSRLSFASLTIPNFPFIIVIFIYGVFLWYLFGKIGGGKIWARFIIITAVFVTITSAGFFAYRHYWSNQVAQQKLRTLLGSTSIETLSDSFRPDPRTKSSNCQLEGPLPDHACTPGAVFADATVEKICVKGYTQTVRNVSVKTRKTVFAEYGLTYPQPRGAYEVDHLIPLALGGSNDIANLFPEAAVPAPGFHEKDIVEVYLQEEVCNRRVTLPAAQRQTATNWLAVYENLTPEEIAAFKKKYGGR